MRLALDIGNSTVKGSLLTYTNQLVTKLNYPSAIVHIPDEKFLNFHHEDDIYLQVLDSPLEHFEGIVAVGNKAINMPNYEEFDVLTTAYKSNQAITTALLFGGLLPYLKNDVTVKLAVSVPIEESKAVGVVKQYKQLLENTHKIRIYKHNEILDIAVTFTPVEVLNEGQAGFFGLLDTLDKEFRETMSQLYVALDADVNPIGDLENFIIVDIGEGTTDVAVFRDKRFNADYSYSVTKGYGNVLESAMETAKRDKLNIESRKALQKLLLSTKKLSRDRRERWLTYIKPESNKFVNDVVSAILRAYGSNDYFDAIIFMGGGFSALTHYQLLDGEIEMSNPQLFEALYHKLADTNKEASLIFGIPEPYSQNINERGLMQIVANMQ